MDFEILAQQLIRAVRAHRSQTAFSRWLGYKSNVVYTWEAGRRWPTASEFVRACEKTGVDVRGAWVGFYASAPPWLEHLDLASPGGTATLLTDLRGNTPISALAERTGKSRFAVSRWLKGEAEPRLPDFLRLIEASSLRLLDWLAGLVELPELPAAADAWRRLEARREALFDAPWTAAVLHALELERYTGGEGQVAEILGISLEEEERCLGLLAESGQITRSGKKWSPAAVMAIDTRRYPQVNRQLKAWWAQVGLDQLQAGSQGQFSYNVFTCSQDDLEAIRELHLAYYRQLRAIVADSEPGERVVVANVQLFALDEGPWGR